MAEFEVSWKKMRDESETFRRFSEELEEYCETIRNIRRELPVSIGNSSQMSLNLN